LEESTEEGVMAEAERWDKGVGVEVAMRVRREREIGVRKPWQGWATERGVKSVLLYGVYAERVRDRYCKLLEVGGWRLVDEVKVPNEYGVRSTEQVQ
jgi:hypothetical protein